MTAPSCTAIPVRNLTSSSVFCVTLIPSAPAAYHDGHWRDRLIGQIHRDFGIPDMLLAAHAQVRYRPGQDVRLHRRLVIRCHGHSPDGDIHDLIPAVRRGGAHPGEHARFQTCCFCKCKCKSKIICILRVLRDEILDILKHFRIRPEGIYVHVLKVVDRESP